jgi:hypothetical protein
VRHTLHFVVAAAALTGLGAFSGPASAAPAARQALTATAVTGAKALTLSNGTRVSFNNGTSWQPAALTRICHGKVCTNQYRATYTAPAGARVSLRVTAHDTHGASVTETILGAYQTG